MRRQWGVEPSALVALFVGKFQSFKRPLDLLEAVASLQTSQTSEMVASSAMPNSSASEFLVPVYVGSGALESDLRLHADFLGVKTVFAGFKNQTELPACYAAADVLVLPSEGRETWGLVVNEAMACGLPAVVSDAVGCAPDLIEEGETGFTYPMGDISVLAGCLLRIAQMKAAHHNWGPELKEKMKVYSIERAVTGTLNALAEAGRIRN